MGLVETWLKGIGLGYAVEAFKAKGFNSPDGLARVSLFEFDELGVSDPSDRKKLFYLVQRVNLALRKATKTTSRYAGGKWTSEEGPEADATVRLDIGAGSLEGGGPDVDEKVSATRGHTFDRAELVARVSHGGSSRPGSEGHDSLFRKGSCSSLLVGSEGGWSTGAARASGSGDSSQLKTETRRRGRLQNGSGDQQVFLKQAVRSMRGEAKTFQDRANPPNARSGIPVKANVTGAGFDPSSRTGAIRKGSKVVRSESPPQQVVSTGLTGSGSTSMGLTRRQGTRSKSQRSPPEPANRAFTRDVRARGTKPAHHVKSASTSTPTLQSASFQGRPSPSLATSLATPRRPGTVPGHSAPAGGRRGSRELFRSWAGSRGRRGEGVTVAAPPTPSSTSKAARNLSARGAMGHNPAPGGDITPCPRTGAQQRWRGSGSPPTPTTSTHSRGSGPGFGAWERLGGKAERSGTGGIGGVRRGGDRKGGDSPESPMTRTNSVRSVPSSISSHSPGSGRRLQRGPGAGAGAGAGGEASSIGSRVSPGGVSCRADRRRTSGEQRQGLLAEEEGAGKEEQMERLIAAHRDEVRSALMVARREMDLVNTADSDRRPAALLLYVQEMEGMLKRKMAVSGRLRAELDSYFAARSGVTVAGGGSRVMGNGEQNLTHVGIMRVGSRRRGLVA